MIIQPYQKKWKSDFGEIKRTIGKSLSNLNVTIEHIGSTSIPNLSAKPVIDLDVVYHSSEEFQEIKYRLERIGYYHNGNQGTLNREVFKRKALSEKHPVLDFIDHHLYVCPAESEELERHLLFRNFLLKNQEAKQLYQDLKINIAKEAKQDRKKYAQLKEVQAKTFILSIVEKAKKA